MLAKLLHLERPLAMLDLETTGTDTKEARICSIGIRTHELNGNISTYSSLVNPGVPMPPEALEAHGLTDEMLAAAPRFAEIAHPVFLILAGCDYGGYNHRNYDVKVLVEEFFREGLVFDYQESCFVDSLRIWQVLEPRTLSDAVAYFLKREHKGAHDAVADIEETEEVLIAQLTTHPRSHLLPKNVRELHALCFPRPAHYIDSEGKFVFKNGVACLNFGKFKGQPMTSCTGYLRWMTTADFTTEVKQIALNAIAGIYPKETQ